MNAKLKLYFYIDLLFFVATVVAVITGVVLWGWLRPPGMTGPGGPPQVQAVAKDAQAAPQNAPAREGEQTRGEKPRGEQGAQGRGNDSNPDMRGRIFWGLLRGNTLLGMSKGVWKNIHCWDSVVMFVLMIVHLSMHARWISNATSRLRQKGERRKNVDVAK